MSRASVHLTGTPVPPAPITIGYVRVSTLSQVNDGDGLGIQRDKIAGWCAYQGLPTPTIEQDAAVSGGTMDNRPGLLRALKAAFRAGPAGVLVIYKLDRLGRNAIDVQEVLAALLDAGVRVVSLSDGVDSASGMGAALLKLLTSILATFAELEKETIRARLLDGRKRADSSNRTYASEPRYGRRVVAEGARELTPDAEEARAVARIRELRTEGLSLRAIAATLDAEGIRPRRAARWHVAVLQRIAAGFRPSREKKSTSARTARLVAAIKSAP